MTVSWWVLQYMCDRTNTLWSSCENMVLNKTAMNCVCVCVIFYDCCHLNNFISLLPKPLLNVVLYGII